MASSDLCNICGKSQFKYSCPKCNIVYCSLNCYKSPEHERCSEEFYKKCVEDELAAISDGGHTVDETKKMYNILQRINQQLAEEGELDLNEEIEDIDSDDYDEENIDTDIASRLEGIDINDSNEIWKLLTEEEKKDFQSLVENGEIMKLLPKYLPWWAAESSKLVTPVSDLSTPKISEDIPEFSKIYQKEPPPCIHNNLWNVITSYACTVKFFNGELHTNPIEAAMYLVAISANLKSNVNFDDAEQAVTSVQMEALAENTTLPCNEFSEIQNDSRQIMCSHHFKLAALSDTLALFKLSKEHQFGSGAKKNTYEIPQKFEGSHLAPLSKKNISLLIKKIEFFLSFVQRDLIVASKPCLIKSVE